MERNAALLFCLGAVACSYEAAPSDGSGTGELVCAPDVVADPPSVTMLEPFRFQVIGDVHGHAASNNNIVRALSDLRSIGPNAAALVINGDLTEHGDVDEYSGLRSAFSGGSAPPLWNIGNHDYHGTSTSAVERQRFLAQAGRSTIWFEKVIHGYPFLLLGGENGDEASWGPGSTLAWYAVLSDAQLDWLDQRLTALATPARPSFVFLHQATWDTKSQARLEQILSSHPNVIFFWSHYHRDLHSAPIDKTLYTNARGFQQVHTGSIQYTWDNASPNNRHDDWFGGLQLEVFSDRIQIRGRDLAARAWIPQFEFQLDQRPPSQLGSIGRDADGRLELLVTGIDGHGLRSVQDRPGGTWSSFVDDGRLGGGAPVVAQDSEGRLAAFAVGADGAIWRAGQDATGTWSTWTSMGGGFTSNVAVGRNRDGTLEVFARGLDHALWHAWQTGSETWSAWTSLGGTITSDVAVIENTDGRLEVLTRGVDNSAFHIWQTAPMGPWSSWTGLGGILISKLAVARHPDGRVVAFALGIHGDVFRIEQGADGNWSSWMAMGGGFASHPVVATNSDGTLEVFVRGNDRALYHVAERDTWSSWASLGGELDSDVTVGANEDGRLELFARGSGGVLEINRQQTPGGCWSGWSAQGVAVDVR